MGDRANVVVRDGDAPPLYFYTHWYGSELPDVVADAIVRGEPRWSDPSYLARIIFSQMIANDVLGETGYGISTELGDGDNRLVVVDMKEQSVTDYQYGVRTFKQIVEAEAALARIKKEGR